MEKRWRFIHNIVLKACAVAGDVDAAENFVQTRMEKVALTNRAYGKIIEACVNTVPLPDIVRAEAWFTRMLEARVFPSVEIISSLINGCAKRRDTAGAHHWFQRGKEFNLVVDIKLITSLVDACARNGDLEEAMQWFACCEETRVAPDIVAYSAVLNGLAQKKDPLGATRWLEKMQQASIRCDEVVLNTVVDAYANAGDPHGAETFIRRMDFVPSRTTLTSLLKASAVGKKPEAAERHFKTYFEGVTPGTCIVNVMMDVYARMGDIAGTKRWFDRFEEFELSRDRVSFTTLFKACRRRNDLTSAFYGYTKLKEDGLQPDATLYNTLLALAGEDSAEVGRDAKERLRAVQYFFSEMRNTNTPPNLTTEKILTRVLGPTTAKQLIRG